MRVLSVDPGAIRCGWAIIDSHPLTLLDSGILNTPRQAGESFQSYRLRVEERTVAFFGPKFRYGINTLATEVIPPRGNHVMTQLYLASCVSAVLHAMAYQEDPSVQVVQISAATMQKKIAIGKRTKVGVRNGVYRFFPELADREWSGKTADETDAIAHGLVCLGYSN